MASQHKRSGKKAKLERQRRVMEAEQQKERERQELLAMRAAIKVILPRRQSRDYYDISEKSFTFFFG
jgi:hypothetical protein